MAYYNRQGRRNYNDDYGGRGQGHKDSRHRGDRGNYHEREFEGRDGGHGPRYGRGARGRGGGGRGRGGGEGNRPPPGLSGREIGMWHAARSKAKKERMEKQQRPVVQMNKSDENKIMSVLNKFDDRPPASPDSGPSPAGVVGQTGQGISYGSDWFDNCEQGASVTSTSLSAPQDKSGRHWSGYPGSHASGSGSFAVAGPQTPGTQDGMNTKRANKPPPGFTGKDIGLWYAEGQQDPAVSSLVKSSGSQGTAAEECIEISDNEDSDEDITPFKDYVELSQYESDIITIDSSDSEFSVASASKELDDSYKKELKNKLKNPEYQRMLKFREKLPSFGMQQEIIETLSKNQVVVISGETGCGKTTQVPQFILDEEIRQGRGSQCHVICTQPRRISAISVAERVAQERAVRCVGDEVGYMIRLESRTPRPRGSILFCTTGCVLKFLESDPNLSRATHIILDEIHERDLHSDFLMIILKDLLPKRPDLKVILMSATLNAEMFSHYFFKCPMLHIPGFTFPVEEFFMEDIVELLNFRAQPGRSFRPNRLHGKKRFEEQEKKHEVESMLQNLRGDYSPQTIDSLRTIMESEDRVNIDLISKLISHIAQTKPDGAILVFVPGWGEISKLNKCLLDQPMFNSSNFRIIPLHSLMPTVNQRQVFDRPPAGVRKIVIATNIAETSITIDDIVYVIDSGEIKVKDFNPENNLSILESKKVSKANAKQRRGRAGRVQPGVCYRLFLKEEETKMIDYFPPELLRTRLEEICLQIKILKLGKILPFISKAMEPPSINALHHAITTLQDLNALSKDEELLPLGYHLARMPVDPNTGKMILFGAMFSCLDPVLSVAASLSYKNAFYTPLGKEAEADEARILLSSNSHSDHILLINSLKKWEKAKSKGQEGQFCYDFFLSVNVLRLLKDMKKQLAKLLQEVGFTRTSNPTDPAANKNSYNLSLVKAIVCAGLYPNVAKIEKCPKPNSRNKSSTVKIKLKDGQKAAMHPVSVNAKCSSFRSKWVIFHQKLKTNAIYVHDTTTISPYPLLFFGGDVRKIVQDGDDCVAVDDWIIFKASPQTANLVKDLRYQLDRLLERKITHPGPTDWSAGSKESELMKVILELITKEDNEMSYSQDSADSDY